MPLVVERVGIERLEGIAGPYELSELCSGINLIYGPNASGKSRTATALQGLIWPDTTPGRAEFTGTLAMSRERWLVVSADRRAEYQCNGSPVSAPSLVGIPSSQ